MNFLNNVLMKFLPLSLTFKIGCVTIKTPPGVFLGSISFLEDVFEGVWFDSRHPHKRGFGGRNS
jgi:hypothetical protein